MLDDLLDKTLNLQRGDNTTDALGGIAPTYATVSGLGAVPCTVWPASTKTIQQFQGSQIEVDAEIVTEIDISALPQDRIVIDGETYLVAGYRPFENSAICETGVYVTAARRLRG